MQRLRQFMEIVRELVLEERELSAFVDKLKRAYKETKQREQEEKGVRQTDRDQKKRQDDLRQEELTFPRKKIESGTAFS